MHSLIGYGVPLLLYFAQAAVYSSGSKVLLSDVKTLTLHRSEYTKNRRLPAIPQLRCVGGSANKESFQPKVVQCYNRGFDGVDVQWECKAEMPKEYEFGKIRVSCEGYDYPEDPYILKGSCGLMYELDYTTKNWKKDEGFRMWGVIGLIAFFYIVYRIYQSYFGGSDTSRHNGGSSWYSGPSPPPDGPSPPGFKTFQRPSYAPPTYDEAVRGSQSSSNFGTNNSGFFTGLGLGALAGYMYGSSGNSENNSRYRGTSRFGEGSGLFNSRRDDSGCSTSGQSRSRTVSGFGGTERR